MSTAKVPDAVVGDPTDVRVRLSRLRESVCSVFRGKEEAVELCLTALLAKGHVLFEDVPGTGKTTLARSVAHSLACTFRRIQFTSDLLPSDVVGVSVFRDENGEFEFRRGPVFANIVLADEVNRTTPRTQSALLEAMSEGRVTVDNRTWDLPQPFMVIATQNPKEFYGTYPLPESQLDRFMLRMSIGYPTREVERGLVSGYGWNDPVAALKAAATVDDVIRWQGEVERVAVAAEVLDYLMSLISATRASKYLALGVSTRGAISMYRAVQARAYLLGREYATPDDVQSLAVPSFSHRVYTSAHREGGAAQRDEAAMIIRELIESVPVPR